MLLKRSFFSPQASSPDLSSLDGARSLLVGIRAALRAALHDAHEAAVERHALLGAAGEDLLLLRLRDLRRLVLHLT